MTTSNNTPEKPPLSQRAISMMFSSSDSSSAVEIWNSQELSKLFFSSRQSSDASAASQQCVDERIEQTKALFSSSDYVANLMKSGDSGLFKSLELPPFHSTDSIGGPSGQTIKSADFSSRDWLDGYDQDHTDVNYRQAREMFQTSTPSTSADISILRSFQVSQPQKTSTNNDTTSKWMSIYTEDLVNPIRRKATTLEAPQQPHVEATEVYRSKSNNRAKKPTQKATNTNQPTKYPSRRVEPKVKEYVRPTKQDILLGRGGKSNNWEGNEKYREAIEKLKPVYRRSAKHEKTIIAQQLIDALNEDGCRFIKYDEDTGKWYIVPAVVARRKAGQALREENTPAARAAKRARYQK